MLDRPVTRLLAVTITVILVVAAAATVNADNALWQLYYHIMHPTTCLPNAMPMPEFHHSHCSLCDPHLSALEVRFSRRGATQIYVYLYLTFSLPHAS